MFKSSQIVRFLITKILSRTKSQKAIEELSENWGKEIDRKRDFKLISLLFKFRARSDNIDIVNDKTWTDLNMDKIFSKIDRTITPPGAQYLYSVLRENEKNTGNLSRRFEVFRIFRDNKDLREKIQKRLLKLVDNDYYYIPDLIYTDLPDKPKGYRYIYLCSAMLLVIIFASTYYPILILAVGLTCLINILIRRVFEKRVFQYFNILANLQKLLKVSLQLSKIENPYNIPELEIIKKHKNASDRLIKRMGYIMVDDTGTGSPGNWLIEYLQYFFLIHLISFCRSHSEIKKNRHAIIEVFESIGSLDASISAASYLDDIPYFSNPVYNNENIIDVEEIYHPLLDDPVPNTIIIENNSVLVTGSNMAGKTTFIRTIAVNILLARALNICFCRRANIPFLTVKSLIKREDDITEGKSYFFREIEGILEFINLSSERSGYLFLIDEIFRGTNTVERISASTAVLKELSKHNIVMVTTHDLELQDLLDGLFTMHHFSEQVEGERYFFDYKIKRGPCSTRNAIKLLELKGYPDEIIRNALALSENLKG
ncbi:MAG: hypothetical protein GY863_02705 [bacterium]|nr:hypothetical protein [bacterium]